nr:MAG TPA: hypothetical protein [Caudoviricetes sp.]
MVGSEIQCYGRAKRSMAKAWRCEAICGDAKAGL